MQNTQGSCEEEEEEEEEEEGLRQSSVSSYRRRHNESTEQRFSMIEITGGFFLPCFDPHFFGGVTLSLMQFQSVPYLTSHRRATGRDEREEWNVSGATST
ncbi:hypothetical protein EYF80_048817 [Liparis tanakae]|uniref:Uncharacterized protein n=1 Tax=Liparis tanakae TaxID=230148 RepID=A0A4Z2FL63_9TELE|nr:hypothetical protein EYF80_048817 [Liparis tanakae]